MAVLDWVPAGYRVVSHGGRPSCRGGGAERGRGRQREGGSVAQWPVWTVCLRLEWPRVLTQLPGGTSGRLRVWSRSSRSVGVKGHDGYDGVNNTCCEDGKHIWLLEAV